MSTPIWHTCKGPTHLTLLEETAWRITDSQEAISTRKLVDSLEEQSVLEELIEANKPAIGTTYLTFHRLLYTPFRCPPLKHGSRFGKRTEPSLWYGSLTIKAVMAEKAFYQFNFLRASEAQYDFVQTPLTLFSANVKTASGIKLNEPPFSNYVDIVSSPFSYDESQQLGTDMREANVEAFTYFSARQMGDINIALFGPNAFSFKNPDKLSFQSWQCIANKERVEFSRSNFLNKETFVFMFDQFVVNDELPFPAT